MQPSGPPPPAPPRGVRLGDLLVLGGALIVFGFSFAPFVQYSDQTRLFLFGLTNVSTSFNAWSLQTFMVPLTTFVIVAALLGIAAAATRFALRRDPPLLGFRLRQLEVGLAMFGFVVLLGMVTSDKHVVVGARRLAEADPDFNAQEVALDTGWGAVLMLVGASIALVGAVLNHVAIGPTITLGTGPAPVPPPVQHGGWQGAPPPPPPGGWQGSPPLPHQPPPQQPPGGRHHPAS